jgi:hypothetical protein
MSFIGGFSFSDLWWKMRLGCEMSRQELCFLLGGK